MWALHAAHRPQRPPHCDHIHDVTNQNPLFEYSWEATRDRSVKEIGVRGESVADNKISDNPDNKDLGSVRLRSPEEVLPAYLSSRRSHHRFHHHL